MSMALMLGEAKWEPIGAGDERRLDRRQEDARCDEQQDHAEHREGEALLLDPAAVLDVVDAAEGGVHRPPEGGAYPERAEEGGDPDRRRVFLDPFQDVAQRLLLGVREESLQIVEDPRLDPLDLQNLAEDEEDEQREGEDGQHQVVGDHRREAGDVLPVGSLPKGAQPGAWISQWTGHGLDFRN